MEFATTVGANRAKSVMDRIENEMRPDFRSRNSQDVGSPRQIVQADCWVEALRPFACLMCIHIPTHTQLHGPTTAQAGPRHGVSTCIQECTPALSSLRARLQALCHACRKGTEAAVAQGRRGPGDRWQQIKLQRAEWTRPRSLQALFGRVLYVSNLPQVAAGLCCSPMCP